ncbi:MAG: hypothetical protein V4534_06735 [Myxococcota bacterium]
MSEKIMEAGIKRETGWMYFLDRELNVYRSKMMRNGQNATEIKPPELVLRTELKRHKDYLYYVDKEGNISQSKASRGGGSRKGQKLKKNGPKKKSAKKVKSSRKAVPKKNRGEIMTLKKAA